jgi:undecaprenyl-diphosphatase
MPNACTSGVDTGFATLGYFKVAILGIVQGITELMPISSTAHMRLVPAVLGWQDPGSAFSAAMQLAALAAVISYFWADVRGLAVNATLAAVHGKFRDRQFLFVLWIVLATVPIGIAGLALAKLLNTCNSPLRAISVIGWACMAMAALLAVAELAARHRRTIDQATWLDALLVGIAQVGALIPGLPAIALAGLKELWELHKVHLDWHAWSVLIVGIGVASVSAFFAIWGLMRILENFSSWPFVIYRFLLGLVILVGIAVGWVA